MAAIAVVDSQEPLDDDQWLYGDPNDDNDEVSNGNGKELFDDRMADSLLDQMDDINELDPPKPSDATPEAAGDQSQDNAGSTQESSQQEGQEDEEKEEDGDDISDSDDDEVNVIFEINNPTPSYVRAGYVRLPAMAGTSGDGLGTTKKIDLDAVPQMNGVPLPDIDLDSIDKPWQKPGADITDYFNYGFTEETWKLYCEKQRKMRYESNQLSKLVVSINHFLTTNNNNNNNNIPYLIMINPVILYLLIIIINLSIMVVTKDNFVSNFS
jgi:pre-mRNA 3'-end-processing factor FIP1